MYYQVPQAQAQVFPRCGDPRTTLAAGRAAKVGKGYYHTTAQPPAQAQRRYQKSPAQASREAPSLPSRLVRQQIWPVS